jgi:hypothetical protein
VWAAAAPGAAFFWFKPGQSGNPGGRPKNHGKAKDQAREFATHAIYSLVQNCCDRRATARERRQSARLLIRIGFGPETSIGDGVLKTLGWENVRRRLERLAQDDAHERGEEVLTTLRRPDRDPITGQHQIAGNPHFAAPHAPPPAR